MHFKHFRKCLISTKLQQHIHSHQQELLAQGHHLRHHEERCPLGHDRAGENDEEGEGDGDELERDAGLLDQVGVLLGGRGGLVVVGDEDVPFFDLFLTLFVLYLIHGGGSKRYTRSKSVSFNHSDLIANLPSQSIIIHFMKKAI